MKRIEGFIRAHRMPKVVAALHALPHFPGFTIVDCHGQGEGRGEGGHFVYDPDEGIQYHKSQIVIVICPDEEAQAIAETIARAGCTGETCDGLVAITDVPQVICARKSGGIA